MMENQASMSRIQSLSGVIGTVINMDSSRQFPYAAAYLRPVYWRADDDERSGENKNKHIRSVKNTARIKSIWN